jgi:signal transduction histidine kinase
MDTRECLEIRHWVQKAIAFLESSGKEETLARIADPKGPFIDGERYIFALDLEGKLLAHPFSKKLVGRNLKDLRDSVGSCFIRKLLAKASKRGYGFVDYIWPVPSAEEERIKTVFFERVDGMVLCSGYYVVEGNTLADLYLSFGPYGPC